jgi:hypothetical protein
MTAQIEQARAKSRELAIENLTAAFKQASGYSSMDHGIDHWREAATQLVDTMQQMVDELRSSDGQAR